MIKKCKDCLIERLDLIEKSNLVETNGRVFFFVFRKQQIISSVEFAQTNSTSWYICNLDNFRFPHRWVHGALVRFPNPLAPGHPDTCQLGNLTSA